MRHINLVKIPIYPSAKSTSYKQVLQQKNKKIAFVVWLCYMVYVFNLKTRIMLRTPTEMPWADVNYNIYRYICKAHVILRAFEFFTLLTSEVRNYLIDRAVYMRRCRWPCDTTQQYTSFNTQKNKSGLMRTPARYTIRKLLPWRHRLC